VVYQTSSSFFTISTVGVLGSNLFILFLSALVTSEGVIGITGENGWYGEYGTGAPVHGVRRPLGDSGVVLSKTVCLTGCIPVVGETLEGSYALKGRAPPARMAEGALDLEKVDPGLGDEGRDNRDGNRLAPGFGEVGRPTRGVVDLSDAADTGSASVVAEDMFREWPAVANWRPILSSMLWVL